MSAVLIAKENYMSEFYSRELELESRKADGEKEPLIQEIFEHIIRNSDGVCYQELKQLDPNNRFNKFGYRLWRNDWKWIASQSRWYKDNYYHYVRESELIDEWRDPIILIRKSCYCKTAKCFQVYIKDTDEAPYDPSTDHSGHIYKLTPIKKEKKVLDPHIQLLYHDSFFNDPNNLLAQEIDRFIEEEAEEEREEQWFYGNY